MRRNILVTATALILAIGSGSLQASTCRNCRRAYTAAVPVEKPVGPSLSGWQQFVLVLPIAFTTIVTGCPRETRSGIR